MTQVLVDIADPAFAHPARGIGPYYDQDKARLYTATRQWSFVLVPGRGYRRAVPSLKPKHVIEARTITTLLAANTLVICAGGGGVPVYHDERNNLVGADAVIDKTHTTSLLATEINAESIIFVSLWDEIEHILQMDLTSRRRQIERSELNELMERARGLDEDLYNKLLASRSFLDAWRSIGFDCATGTPWHRSRMLSWPIDHKRLTNSSTWKGDFSSWRRRVWQWWRWAETR